MSELHSQSEPTSNLIIYQTEDGRTRIQCRFENETVWLSLNQLADLFQRDKSVISRHIKNVFDEAELRAQATVAKFATVQNEGGKQVKREIEFYNLDVILAVGFRVRSHRGTQFRQWASGRLHEYLVKGFTMDDERLKNPPGKGQQDYFDEQLARIRDIRSSERRFYQKVLDIYATSVDYTPNTEVSQQFFVTVQNKMHWGAHGQTAAEVIHARVDAQKPFMGQKTTRTGGIVRKEDVGIAKNYLDADELDTLNRIVTAYIEFAELRALQRKVMTMRDWITKLDDFLKLSEHELLSHAGKISAEQAKLKAQLQYDQYRKFLDAQPRAVDLDFDKATVELKQLTTQRKARPLKP